MNKKILAASAILAAVSMSFGMETWVGGPDSYRVETGVGDATDDTYGYWYDYNDNKETADNGPGTSSITWPTDKGNQYADDAMDPIIDMCGGICGSATMGGPYKYPFVGVGFNLVSGNQEGADISSWGGICLGYKSDGIAPALEIAPEDEGTLTKYNNYKASLKIAAVVTVVDLPWAQFKQEAGWGNKVDQSVVLSKASAIKKSASALKASVAGRTLAISGVKAGATVEVINLQGQVMLKSVLNSANASLNLANMDAGIYMVRVAGQANLSQKIVLK